MAESSMRDGGGRRESAWVRGVLCAVVLCAQRGAAAETPGRAEIIEREAERVRGRVEALGGWEAWDASLAGWRQAIAGLPLESRARRGTDGMLFNGGTAEFLQRGLRPKESGGVVEPPWEASAVKAAVELSAYLAERGIDLIVVPVPCALSIYPGRSGTAPPSEVGLQYLRLVSEMLAQGVEAIDLYSPFLEHRFESGQLLYYRTDHHWNGRGIALGARLIAERLSRYPALVEAKSQPAMYVRTPVTTRQWIGGLAEGTDSQKFPPEDIERLQVFNADGTQYGVPAGAPVVIVGDSFAQYHRFEGTATDVGPNLAYELNCPVQTLSNDGIVARQVPRRIARQGPEFLNGRLVVVWIAMDISFQEGQLRSKGVEYR